LSDPAAVPSRRKERERLLGELLEQITPFERYWAFPGTARMAELLELYAAGDYETLLAAAEPIAQQVVGDRPRDQRQRPSFEVLMVADLAAPEAEALAEEFRRLRRPDDKFTYELVILPSFEDALVAIRLNYRIQACVIRHDFRLRSRLDVHSTGFMPQGTTDVKVLEPVSVTERVRVLGKDISELRPELDLYLVGHSAIEALAGEVGRGFDRVFVRRDALEMHLSILGGVEKRYETPFFNALRHYSRRPTGVFHALPISRGRSVINSPWVSDMADFYGLNIMLAETSATSGGLDSLLEPVGAIKRAQELAARAFGAHHSYFVTNGTSTANKIVMQSIVMPGEVVLVDRNCHKSHHYALMLAGAQAHYLDAYPLDDYSIYGAVPLQTIKRQLLAYRRAGRLDQVKLLTLTNCTFDGIVYDVERVMEECLAIKPDLVFLWDEAWFAFAGFHPAYRRRTAMDTTRHLYERYRDLAYRERYAAQAAELADADDETLLNTRLLPDPDAVVLRVYATQSTHKTLTALRQGSMIHVFDQHFGHRNEEAFREAYMTHTSTSPNYQILASLDIGRRQVELEGFELVQKQLELAMVLRDVVASQPLLKKYFRILGPEDLIPAGRSTGGLQREQTLDSLAAPSPPAPLGSAREQPWERDEFALDPSRVTLHIGLTGVDGDRFKHEYLMKRYGIQVNKTSRNTVLFMTSIGTTRSSVAYLIEVLVRLAQELEDEVERMGPFDRRAHDRRVKALTSDPPPLPDFSAFHPRFRGDPTGETPEGDVRAAFFLAYRDGLCEYVTGDEAMARLDAGRDLVSATFVIPYPPGFPILVPGQVISRDILAFMQALDTREIHGYMPGLGYRVFTDEALAETLPARS
ncbi:MAG: aminotransferase class I/II-fold pyridoxal phosphate-dependent enzyme, partial [Actinomycetes bacterium]